METISFDAKFLWSIYGHEVSKTALKAFAKYLLKNMRRITVLWKTYVELNPSFVI